MLTRCQCCHLKLRNCEKPEFSYPYIVLLTTGSQFGYHAITYGLYVDRLVQLSDSKGRDTEAYFQEEIAQPFGKVSRPHNQAIVIVIMNELLPVIHGRQFTSNVKLLSL